MRLRFVVLASLALTPNAWADQTSPWFGSEASVPEQISFVVTVNQLVDSDAILPKDLALACPIEGCPNDGKLAKQPE